LELQQPEQLGADRQLDILGAPFCDPEHTKQHRVLAEPTAAAVRASPLHRRGRPRRAESRGYVVAVSDLQR
jgi:hypothetical protein